MMILLLLLLPIIIMIIIILITQVGQTVEGVRKVTTVQLETAGSIEESYRVSLLTCISLVRSFVFYCISFCVCVTFFNNVLLQLCISIRRPCARALH